MMNHSFFSTQAKHVKNKLNALTNSARTLFLVLFASLSLTGCVTALVAGAVITTIDIIHDRRTAGEYIDDAAIELTAGNVVRGSEKAIRKGVHLKAQSWNGILLITGEVDSEESKQILLPKLRAIQGVRQVVDETNLTSKTGLLTRANDSWIATRVKSRLVLKTGFAANRIKIVTTRKSVYLMGIVTQEEAHKATEIARSVKGVARVVKVFEYTTTPASEETEAGTQTQS